MQRLQVAWWRFWRRRIQRADALAAALWLYQEGHIYESQVKSGSTMHLGMCMLKQKQLCRGEIMRHRTPCWQMLEDENTLRAWIHREANRVGVQLVIRDTPRGLKLEVEPSYLANRAA